MAGSVISLAVLQRITVVHFPNRLVLPFGDQQPAHVRPRPAKHYPTGYGAD